MTSVNSRFGMAISDSDSPPETQRMFRADIQALRMVAVTAVLIYHLWPQYLPGGFIGVDVFFVISGLLITQHLLKEVYRTGHIRLATFWSRRIRRLLPASFLVGIASLLLLFFAMPPLTWASNLEAVAASALYAVNWLLGFRAVDYLAAESGATLVTHYWSLAVEEQFYLVWPLLILAALKISSSRDLRAIRLRVSWLLSAVFILTLVSSILYTPTSSAMAFYATPVRAWEFASGGLLALAGSGLGRLPNAMRIAMSWIGIIIIILTSVFLRGSVAPFPGWIALVPVSGAVLFLAAWDPQGRFSMYRLGRVRAVQWMGDHSYGIYLWHWPPIVAAPWILNGPLTWPWKLAILVATLVLATLTKRYVEDPVRTGVWWQLRMRRTFTFGGVCSITIASVCISSTMSLNAKWDEYRAMMDQMIESNQECLGAAAMLGPCEGGHERPSTWDVSFASADTGNEGINNCQQPTSGDEAVFCVFGETKNPQKTIAIIGNSHALRLVPALEEYGRGRGWQVLLAAKTDCLGLMTPEIDPKFNDCQSWSRNVADKLFERDDIDAVVFGSHATAQGYLAGADATAGQVDLAKSGIISTFLEYRKHGIPVLVTTDVPGTRPIDAPSCVELDSNDSDPCARPRTDFPESNLLVDVARQNSDLASVFDIEKYLCDETTCHAVIGGLVAYSDSHHLTASFARTLGPFLGPAVEEIFQAN